MILIMLSKLILALLVTLTLAQEPSASYESIKVPLVHLPREDLFHGIVYVGSSYARMQVMYDTMLEETFLTQHSTDGNLIPSNLDLQ